MIACRLLRLRPSFVRTVRNPAALTRRLAALALLLPGAALADPTLVKSFAPASIGPGSSSTLVIRLDNLDDPQTEAESFPVRGLAFTDDLPPGVYLASPVNARTDCTGAVVTAPDGGSRIEFSGGQLPSDSSCQLSVDVTSAVTGVHTNSIFELSWEGGSTEFEVPPSADLSVDIALPGFTKVFAPSSIPLGGTSTLTFTIDNSAQDSVDLFSLSFTDNLPAGMIVGTPANAVTDCIATQFPNTTLTAVSGSSTVSLFANGFNFPPNLVDPVLSAGSSCIVSVDVTPEATGRFGNISEELFSTSTASPTTVSSGFASAVLDVPVEYLVKSFIDDPVPPGGTVTLEFTVTNLSRDGTATDIAFSDDLESVLAGLAPGGPLPTLPCGAGSALDFSAGVLSLGAGTLAPAASCTFGIPLLVPAGAAAGEFTNTTDALTALIDGTPILANTATDILRVQAVPTLTKEFIDDPVGAGGSVTLEFTITNTSQDFPLTEIAFQDLFAEILPTASSVPDDGFCGPDSSALFTPLTNPPSPSSGTPATLSVTGASLAPGASCTFSLILDVDPGAAAGIYPNTTSDIAGQIDTCGDGCLEPVSGLPASDDLEVVAAPSLTKLFADDPVLPGGTVNLEFTLSHDEFAPGDATAITFTDDLGLAGLTLAAIGLPVADVCGPGSEISGTTNLSFTGGSLAPGESCSFGVSLQVPDPAPAGSYANTTSGVVATVLGVTATGNAASDDLDIAGLTVAKEFIDDPVLPGETATLRFTLENAHPTDDATGIFFLDDLNAALAGLAAVAPLPVSPCGGTLSGTSSLTFSGGSLAAGSPPCSFDVAVAVPAVAEEGVYTNTTSNVFATLGGAQLTLPPAVDALTVNSSLLLLGKEFTDDPVSPGGTVTLEFTLSNLDSVEAVTDIAFSDDLDAALTGLQAVGLPLAACGGVLESVDGGMTINLTGAGLAASESCTFSATLTVPADVPLGTAAINTTSAVTGLIGDFPVTGDPAIDSLLIDFLAFSKSFDRPVVPGDVVTLSFSIQNLDASNPVSAMGFSDDLNAVVPGLAAIGLPLADVCGPGSQLAGTSFLTLSGANLLPGGSCTFSVDLQLPANALPGTYPNITSELLVSGLPYSNPASADLEVLAPASIVVRKATAPAGGTGFAFTSSLDPASFTLDDGQEQRFEGLYPGSYSVTETVPAGWDLTGLVCEDPSADTTTSGATANIELAAGETVTCTFTNTQRGSIVIEKVTEPAGATGFAFSDDIAEPGSFFLDDGQSQTFADLVPGLYSVTEIVPPGWDLSNLSCADASGGTTTDGATASIELAPGETVTCTFTNTQQGAIVVEKQTLPDGAPDSFDFSGDASGSIGDGGQIVVTGLAPGTYTSTETVPAGWDLTGISCDDADSGGDLGTATATFNVEPGETVKCIFNNTALGSILIEKATAPEGGTGFDFISDIGDAGFSLDDGQVQTFSNLLPGSYSVTELVPAGWDLSSIDCDDPSGDSSGDGATALIELAVGETVRCLFSNAQRGGIVIEKTSDPAGATGFEFSHDIDENGSFSLDDGGSMSFGDLPAGLYTVTEAVPPGWVLSELACEDPSGGTERLGSAALIDLAPGETVTCRFGNVAALIEITKTALSTPIAAGESAAFTIALRNSGLVALSNLKVSDPLSPNCTRAAGELPDLAPGGSASYDCRSEPLFGDLQNQATVTADVPEGPPVSASATALVEVIAPQVEIDKQAAADQILAGEIAVFTISIHNPGDSPLIDVQVRDDLTPDCVRELGSLPDLAPGVTLSYDCATDPLGEDLENVAQVLAFNDAREEVSASASALVEVIQPLVLTKTPSEQEIPAGESAVFTLTISNPGAVEKTNLLVEDPLVPACGFALESLAPGASVSQSCESGPLFADLINRASATADSPAGPVTATATALVTVLQPSVGIAKTPEAQLVNPGEVASFTITLSNPGDTTLSELAVSDPLTPDCDRAIGELAPLPPGASVSYVCASGPLDAGFTNLASVSGFAGALAVAASASALVTLRQPILIEKSPAEQLVPIGTSAQFTITVSNPGEDLKTGVRVEDPLSPDCARAAGEIPDLQPNGGVFSYVCSSAPLNLDLLNQATVIAEGADGQVSASDTALALVLEPLVSFSKTALEPQIEAGASARFRIEIANPGSEILSQISVADPLVPDCGRGENDETPGEPLADLGPGESLSYECESDLLYADLLNLATVSALAGTELVSAEASAAVDVVTPIEITKAPDEQQILAGESAWFEITLSNPSLVTRTELAVSDPLTPDCDRAVGSLPDLAPGATLSYQCQTGPLFAGFTNQATVSAQGPTGSSSASDNAEVLVLTPEIGIVKAPPVQLVDPGGIASFTITVNNPGSGDLLGVQVTDTATPDCSRNLGVLPPGVTVSYDCVSGALDTDFTNLAQVDAESAAGAPVSASASAFVNVLNTIEIFKLPVEQALPAGSQASFEITLVNESDGLLTNLAVSDPLSPDCERPLGSLPDLLPNGGSYTYLCLSPVLSADLLNVATVSADSADGPVSATASALVEVLVPQTCFTDVTATGSGEATLCFTGGGPGCGFGEVAYIALSGDPLSPPAGSAPDGLLFPHGLVVHRIGEACDPGFTADFTWELPTSMPEDTLLWKYGPTPDDRSPHWYSLPAVVSGNVVSFSITDGALGDNDLAENGTIIDPGGPAFVAGGEPTPIPSLHWLALALLSLMLGLLGAQRPWR